MLSRQLTEAGGKPSPIRLGLASYTFRNFPRAQMITLDEAASISPA